MPTILNRPFLVIEPDPISRPRLSTHTAELSSREVDRRVASCAAAVSWVFSMVARTCGRQLRRCTHIAPASCPTLVRSNYAPVSRGTGSQSPRSPGRACPQHESKSNIRSNTTNAPARRPRLRYAQPHNRQAVTPTRSQYLRTRHSEQTAHYPYDRRGVVLLKQGLTTPSMCHAGVGWMGVLVANMCCRLLGTDAGLSGVSQAARRGSASSMSRDRANIRFGGVTVA